MEQGRCPICRRDPVDLTIEHIIGEWLHEAVGRRWRHVEIAKIKMPICGQCNPRLGDAIEQQVSGIAAPMILDDQPTELTLDRSRVLRRWVLKVLAMMRLSRFESPVPVDVLDWLAFRPEDDPPDRFAAWVGHYVEGAATPTDVTMPEPALPFEFGPYSFLEFGGMFCLERLAVLGVCPPAYEPRLPTHWAERVGFLVPLIQRREAFPVGWPPPLTMNGRVAERIAATTITT